MTDANSWRETAALVGLDGGARAYGRMVSLNENIAGVWEPHPVVERSTLRRSVVNFQYLLRTTCVSALPGVLDGVREIRGTSTTRCS